MTSTSPSRTLVLHPVFLGLFPLLSLLSANMAWAGLGEVAR